MELQSEDVEDTTVFSANKSITGVAEHSGQKAPTSASFSPQKRPQKQSSEHFDEANSADEVVYVIYIK